MVTSQLLDTQFGIGHITNVNAFLIRRNVDSFRKSRFLMSIPSSIQVMTSIFFEALSEKDKRLTGRKMGRKTEA